LQPLPIQHGQWDNAAKVCADAQRTHTAARPSRIFTVFPFDYPAEKSQPNLKMLLYIFQRTDRKDSGVLSNSQEHFTENLKTAESE